MPTDVDAEFAKATLWHDEALRLRPILLDCGLTEALKWRKPTYQHDGDNIAILQRFKGFLALMFFKGALLDDPHEVLESQGENTRSALRIVFRSVDEVEAREDVVRDLVRSAIAVKDQEVPKPDPEERELAPELQARLDADPALKAAFEGLTPGRQREYDLHISGAKQSATRARRVEKFVPRILAGKGMRDR